MQRGQGRLNLCPVDLGDIAHQDTDGKKDGAKLIESEERETGGVSGRVYWTYTVSSGGLTFVTL